MTIELLPPTPRYPDKYHVRPNYCRCHPETCCCDDWAVYKPDGGLDLTFFRQEDAVSWAKLQNSVQEG